MNLAIKNRRIELAMTQLALAAKSKVSQANISKIEGGHLSTSFEALQRILKALNLEIKLEVIE